MQPIDINYSELEFIEEDNYIVVGRANKFFRLGKVEANMLKDLTIENNIPSFLDKYQITEAQLETFLNELHKCGILGEMKKEKKNILFFKIPLINPDRFLDFCVRTFLQNKHINLLLISMLFLCILYGSFLFILNFDQMNSLLFKDLSIQHIVYFYILSISIVFIHELGHAITCKYFGGKVEEIGFLLLFFSPALYCDVSGLRMFKQKYKKIVTLLAGVVVQLLAFSTLTILFHHYENSGFIATFAIWNLLMIISNIVPLIKLDGYWILSTLIDIPNLYEKSLKLALGNRDGVLFDSHEIKWQKFIKIYGQLNLILVFSFIIFGMSGLYKLSTTLEGTFKYIIITFEVCIYLMISVFFIHLLYKLREGKVRAKKG